MCAAQQLEGYHDPEDLCGEEWELNDREIAALDLQGASLWKWKENSPT